MITITTRHKPGTRGVIYGRLALPFDQRRKSRLRTQLASGEDVALMLAPGEILRGGDCLAAADGRVIEVVAAPERLLHVECDTPMQLARAAYHLGNRHMPVQVGADFLRLLEDHVSARMLQGLGARVTHLEAPFEPEGGAYGTGGAGDAAGRHHHRGEAPSPGAHIHEYGKRS